jgi:hypothetical protein
MNTDKNTDCKVPWCNRQSQVNDERCAIHSEVHSAYRSASVASDSPNITTRQAKRIKTNARVTQYVNADNKLVFCVSIVNEGLIPHADEGRVLGHYDNAKQAQQRASIYNNEGI